MHELALASSVVETIAAQSAAGTFSRVEKVILEIGALSCVEPEALSFGFASVAKGSIAEGAILEIRRPQGAAQCFACEATVEISRKGDPCPNCGSHQLFITAGEELKIKSLEVS